MKQLRNLMTLMILAAISAGMPATEAQAESRVHVGVDLGGIVAVFDHGPRYVYQPPVVYEPRHAWRPPPRVYSPPRWHHSPPPPPPHYDRYRHRHQQAHMWDRHRR